MMQGIYYHNHLSFLKFQYNFQIQVCMWGDELGNGRMVYPSLVQTSFGCNSVIFALEGAGNTATSMTALNHEKRLKKLGMLTLEMK